MSAPTARRGRGSQRDGRAHAEPAPHGRAHAWPPAHTCALSQGSEPLQQRWRHAEIPRAPCRGRGQRPGNFAPHSPVPRVGHLWPCHPRAPMPVPGKSRPCVCSPAVPCARDRPVRERNTRGKRRGIGLCVGEAGPCRPRVGSILSAGKPGWGEGLPAHPGGQGDKFSAPGRVLAARQGLCSGLCVRARGWGARPAALREPHAALPPPPVNFGGTLSKDVFQSCCSPGSGWGARLRGCAAPVPWVCRSCAGDALPLPPWPFPGCPERGRQRGLC